MQANQAPRPRYRTPVASWPPAPAAGRGAGAVDGAALLTGDEFG
jgi:hypothetical protein